jgi:hypothetical protein
MLRNDINPAPRGLEISVFARISYEEMKKRSASVVRYREIARGASLRALHCSPAGIPAILIALPNCMLNATVRDSWLADRYLRGRVKQPDRQRPAMSDNCEGELVARGVCSPHMYSSRRYVRQRVHDSSELASTFLASHFGKSKTGLRRKRGNKKDWNVKFLRATRT